MQISVEYLKEQQKVIAGAIAQTHTALQQLIGQQKLVEKQIADAELEDKVSADGHSTATLSGKELDRQVADKEGGQQAAPREEARDSGSESDIGVARG